MNKEEYLNIINEKKAEIGMWDVILEENSKAGFVMGYCLNPDSNMYDVYINDERGRQRIRLSTSDESAALKKLLSMIEFEIESNG
jgi:hypothetical protein